MTKGVKKHLLSRAYGHIDGSVENLTKSAEKPVIHRLVLYD
jgi:hypothetical protein